MKHRIRRMAGLVFGGLLMLSVPLVSRADGDVIERITLEVNADIRAGEKCSVRDFEFILRSSDCEVRYAEIMNTNEVWGSADVPRVLVYLRPDPGYVFSVGKADIQVIGAEFEYGRWDEDVLMYVLQLRFPSLLEQVGEIAEARWSSQTAAEWSPAYNAAYYEVQVFSGEKKQGAVIRTESPACDLGSYMRTEGTYYYKVRAVNRVNDNVKSSWKESASILVDAGAAAQNRQNYAPPVGNGPLSGPNAEAQPYYHDMYGWIAEGALWWYRNADGSYTTNDWQYIDDKWYYFDSRGYMVTGWIDWNGKSYYCDPESGAMLVNTVVPDGLGLRVDSSGALIE